MCRSFKEVDVAEQDVIGHLIDVERQAYDLLLEAQTEADRRIKAARESAEADYRAACVSMIASLDAAYASAVQECDEAKKKEFDAFKERLEAITKNQAALNACLESIFSGN